MLALGKFKLSEFGIILQYARPVPQSLDRAGADAADR
jgi:hypothetical protein